MGLYFTEAKTANDLCLYGGENIGRLYGGENIISFRDSFSGYYDDSHLSGGRAFYAITKHLS